MRIITCLLCCSVFTLFGQQTKKVLFLGNSYIYSNDLPTLVSNIAAADGNTLIKDQNTIGGYTFQAHSTNATTLTKIAADDWDYVVLQEQSQLPSFPWSQVQSDVFPFAESLCNSIRNNNACTVPVFFDTWGRQNGDPQWDSIDTFTEMNQRLYNAYDFMANENSALLSPVGIAFEHIYNDGLGDVTFAQLYSGDGSHPSIFGSYLAACIFYQQLFETDVMGNTYTPAGITSVQRDYLQDVANHVLTLNDTIAISYIQPVAAFNYTISGLSVSFMNTSFHDFEWSWDFGDGNTSVLENPSHVYSTYGNYNVELIAIYCDAADTINVMIDVSALGVETLTDNFRVVTNPSNDGNFYLQNVEIGEFIFIYDSQGKSVEKLVANSTQEIISLPKGIYFLQYKHEIIKLISI